MRAKHLLKKYRYYYVSCYDKLKLYIINNIVTTCLLLKDVILGM